MNAVVPDMYKKTVLRDFAQEFVTHSLGQIDTNQKIIQKVTLFVQSEPWQIEWEGDANLNLFAQINDQHDIFLFLPLKDTMNDLIGNALIFSWLNVARTIDLIKNGPIAYVRGTIELQTETVDKESRAPEVRNIDRLSFSIGDMRQLDGISLEF